MENQERTRIELVKPEIVLVTEHEIRVYVDGIVQNGKQICDLAIVHAGDKFAYTNNKQANDVVDKVALNYAVGKIAFAKGIKVVAKGLHRKVAEIEDMYEQMRDIDGGEKMWDLRIENNMETLINMSSMLDCMDELMEAVK